MLCFSVDSKDSLENVESKWVGEIAENCQGVKLVLVALKCDLRERGGDEEEETGAKRGGEKVMIDYKQGLEVAKRIQALRYLGMFPSPQRLDVSPWREMSLHLLPAQSAQQNGIGASTKHSQKQRESHSQSRAPARLVKGASAQ